MADNDEFTAITTQADLDRIVGARVAREASKYADYDLVKADAAKLSTERDAHVQEIQSLKEGHATALAAKDKDLADRDLSIARLTVAADKGVPAKLLTGSTPAELAESADALLAFKGNKPADQFSAIPGLGNISAYADRDAEARVIFGI